MDTTETTTVNVWPTIEPIPDGDLIPQRWDATFIVLAYIVSFISAFSSVRVLDHTTWRRGNQKQHVSYLLRHPDVLVAFVFGGGTIWSMHFVGMSALSFHGVPMCFNWYYTLLSLFCAVSFVWAGVKVASYDVFAGKHRLRKLKRILMDRMPESARKRRSQPLDSRQVYRTAFFHELHYIFFGSHLAAIGALTMHYTGMQAMRGPFRLIWDWHYVAASVVIAVVICFVGFWIVFRLLHWKVEQFWLRPVSAGVLAAAVCLLHFFGMLGARFISDETVLVAMCAKITNRLSPNAWDDHQVVVASLCLFVPAMAVIIENSICRELLLAYANLKDPRLSGMGMESTERSAHQRNSQIGTSDVVARLSMKMSQRSSAMSDNMEHLVHQARTAHAKHSRANASLNSPLTQKNGNDMVTPSFPNIPAGDGTTNVATKADLAEEDAVEGEPTNSLKKEMNDVFAAVGFGGLEESDEDSEDFRDGDNNTGDDAAVDTNKQTEKWNNEPEGFSAVDPLISNHSADVSLSVDGDDKNDDKSNQCNNNITCTSSATSGEPSFDTERRNGVGRNNQ